MLCKIIIKARAKINNAKIDENDTARFPCS